MNITSLFSIVGLLAAFGLGMVSFQTAGGGAPARSTGLANRLVGGAAAGTLRNNDAGTARLAERPSGVVGMKTRRRPLDTVGGTPAH